ncbi:MAG: hypothetical protein AVDCRST_MAG10-2482 [uncultured Acidimicrobiales bacterium]|uniref:Uncharacterized protein n=1 Tax=uncultured Acidimicrobiales bacterium TaxID=310071 RepID=A0A6J4IP51_9ACTN|nr:MAG: hypothetical protein AVDCRST_MAG10-2482 [uncultured Acidimicrobiales bacterium]
MRPLCPRVYREASGSSVSDPGKRVVEALRDVRVEIREELAVAVEG